MDEEPPLDALQKKLAAAPPPPEGVRPDFWRILWLQAYMSDGLPRWLLDHGSLFSGARCWPERGVSRECFRNAGMLALSNPHLRYCEGLAASPGMPLPLPHAWVVDEEGLAWETTWQEPGLAYLGAVFCTDALYKLLEEIKVWGVLDVWAPAWVLDEPHRWKDPRFEGILAWQAARASDEGSAPYKRIL